MTDHVYFVRSGDRIKIGYSCRPKQRIASFAVHLPDEPELIGTVPGGRELEQRIHTVLDKYRTKGEWFRDCEDVRAVMSAVLGHSTEPEDVVLPSELCPPEFDGPVTLRPDSMDNARWRRRYAEHIDETAELFLLLEGCADRAHSGALPAHEKRAKLKEIKERVAMITGHAAELDRMMAECGGTLTVAKRLLEIRSAGGLGVHSTPI